MEGWNLQPHTLYQILTLNELLLSHVQNEDKHLTRQMMENSKYLTTKTYSLNKLIQEYK